MEPAGAQDEGGAWKLGGEEAVTEAQFVAKRHGGRLLYQQRVGTRVDDELADALCHDDAARPLVALENEH